MNDLIKDGSVDDDLTFPLPRGLTHFQLHRTTTAKRRAWPEC